MNTIISAIPANVIVDASPAIVDANTVVFHDTAAIVAATNSVVVSAYKELEAIAIAKDTWEATVYRTSNDQLYALLQRCYGLYTLMCRNGDTAQQLVDDVDKYLAEKGYRKSNKTHILTKIVKAVFGVDRRRISAYSIALHAAVSARVAVADLPQYIRDNGGVEKLRLAKTEKVKSSAHKVKEARQFINRTVVAKLKLDMLAGHYNEGEVGAQRVLLVTQAADGTFDLHGLVSAPAVVTAALAAFYSQQAKKAAESAPERQQTNRDTQVAELVQQAALSVIQ